ncbi:MAG: cob(I)yrinic acid a,c-diamide adenosyltransferase [Deltaproteobacteria bacterium]|nr:cob(I)yrinic acid a,c-diamide adenosyltransferase [Deltaproteobacteria bacterium]
MGAAKALVHIYTGEGKGKTTASIGLAVRAVGSGMKVLFVQFFKEDSAPSGEKEVLKAVGVDLVRSNCRHPLFTGARTDLEAVRASVVGTYEAAKEKLMSGGYNLVVFDEIMSAINGGWIKTDDILSFLDSRPEGLEVVLTGRNAPVELMQSADYVTEMLKIKHPFDNGVQARKGIEY